MYLYYNQTSIENRLKNLITSFRDVIILPSKLLFWPKIQSDFFKQDCPQSNLAEKKRSEEVKLATIVITHEEIKPRWIKPIKSIKSYFFYQTKNVTNNHILKSNHYWKLTDNHTMKSKLLKIPYVNNMVWKAIKSRQCDWNNRITKNYQDQNKTI